MSSSDLSLESYQIPFEEIQQGTDNFSTSNILGGGGFGTVYKGTLPNHDTVAVKRLNSKSQQGAHEFKTEISMLYTYKHENIVTIIGYCDKGSEMIIVYEYATNKSLDTLLSHRQLISRVSWKQRLKICIGAARGLCHLHWGLGSNYRIIHRDVKSANILLDDDLNAKISDFGLSKFSPKDQWYTHLQTKVAGTDGYLDPEYLSSRVLTKESDVYSFGVVLFEVLCGRLVFPRNPNLDGEHEDSHSLTHLVQNKYKDKLEAIVDGAIKDQIAPESLDTYKKIAYQCIKRNYAKRPKMTYIVEKLEEALAYQNEYEPYDWEQILPHDYEELIKRSHQPIVYKDKRELCNRLYHGILLDGNKWFSLSRLNEKSCLFISAMGLFEDTQEIIWKSIRNSRFSVVAQFGSTQFDHTKVSTKQHISSSMLSAETRYAIFMIYRYVYDGSRPHQHFTRPPTEIVDCYYGKQQLSIASEEWRDEWMEMEICQFTNHHQHGEVNFEFQLHWKYGVYVQGIEFRPIDSKEIKATKTYRGQELRSDYKEIIKRSSDTVKNTPEKELYSLLINGIFIDDSQMWFWLRKSDGKKCIMISTQKMTIEHTDDCKVTKETDQASRFPKVMKFCRVWSLEIRAKIEVSMLSLQTPYAAWLVFKCSLHSSPSIGVRLASLVLGQKEKQTRYVYLGASSDLIAPLNEEGVKDDERRLDRRARKRNDGWMEVELFPFDNDKEVGGEVEVGLQIIQSHFRLTDFTVQGIEFRPQSQEM